MVEAPAVAAPETVTGPCIRCGQPAWPLQEGQCQACLRLDLTFPLPTRQHVAPGLVVGRRLFLGALAALVVGGRWLRPEPEISLIMANGFLIPPQHHICRCVTVTTWNYDQPHLEPGDVIRLTLPESRPALFMLTNTSDHSMTLREL